MRAKRSRPALMFLGMENSGKTSVLNGLMGLSSSHVSPTIGYEQKVVKIGKKTKAKVLDFGGKPEVRKIWREFYHLADGIVFFVDGTDAKKFEEVELLLMEVARDTKQLPVMVLITHQDIAGCYSSEMIAEELRLHRNLVGRKWGVHACSTAFKFGFMEAMKSMKHMILDKK